MNDSSSHPNSRVLLEVCVDSLASVKAAIEGGAHRLELCSSLSCGGLTPSAGFVRKAAFLARKAGISCVVLLRPRAGDFVYSDDEFDVIMDDLMDLKQWCDGFVLGVLKSDSTIDIARTRKLVDAAGAEKICTFHRAIDQTVDILAAVEDAIDAGCRRILTSGGATTAEGGADVIQLMIRRSMGRIQIIAGSGINVLNVELVIELTGCDEIHGSFAHGVAPLLEMKGPVMGLDDRQPPVASKTDIEKVVKKIK